MAIPKWQIEADYMETCNCNFGCPCNFSGFPTGGRCEALVGFHIRKGNYGDVVLDGLDFVQAVSWPRAIHQGDGTQCVYITDRASEEQRAALTEIVYGRAGGTGCFSVFAQTFRYVNPPEFVPIEMHVDGKRGSFAIPGVLQVQMASHVDPVTGKDQEVQVNVPNGFIFKTAEAAKTALMRILSPRLSFDYSGQNAFYSVIEYHGP